MLALEARDRFRLLDHTADLRIEVTGPTLGRLCEAAVLGLVDVIVDAETVRPAQDRRLALEAADRELLLVKLLRETLYLYDVERWLPARADVEAAEDGRSLTAALGGERLDPQRHAIKTEVKAVTYHALEIRETAEGLRARLVLDL